MVQYKNIFSGAAPYSSSYSSISSDARSSLIPYLRLQGMTVIGKLWMTAANDKFSLHVSDGKNRLTLTISKDNLQDFIHDLNRVVEQ